MGALAAGREKLHPKRLENAWLKSTMARENHQLRSLRCPDFDSVTTRTHFILIDLALRTCSGGFGTPCACD